MWLRFPQEIGGELQSSFPVFAFVVSQELEASGMSGLVLESDSTAQDVKLHSDFGSVDEKGVFTQGQKVKAVKYSVLYMKAIKALQESMERIEQLEAKVTALESA